MKRPPAPPQLVSRVSLRVRFCETDLMGIVHHANYLQYFEVGRVDWLQRRGVSYEAWTRQGVHLPVVDVKLRYRKAARFDDELVIETSCSETTRATVLFTYRVLRSEELLCEGETLLACVGQTLTAQRFPDHVAEVLSRAEQPRGPEGMERGTASEGLERADEG